MNNGILYRKMTGAFCISLLPLVLLMSFIYPPQSVPKTGLLTITFKLMVNGRPLVLNDSIYSNVFGETYQVSKFKFYISRPGVKNIMGLQTEKQGYHLVDATQPVSQSFSFNIKAGKYNELLFQLGVDSTRNCSGAQTGALDPLNDMFWTWNSGYVMFKMEGISPVSSSINHRFEYHIGGYKGKDNVVQKINLLSPDPITIAPGKTTEIIIETDISNWWNTLEQVTIRGNPVCTTPGQLAKKIASNYRKMFALRSTAVKK